MPLSLNEIKDRAETFARAWRGVVSERAEAQTFWNEFLDVFGVNRRRVAAFERPIRAETGTGRIDMLWKGKLLVEHKSLGQNLDRAAGQARDYFAGLRDADLPRYVIVSDFALIRLYDLEGPDPAGFTEFPLMELPKRISLFGFISGYETRHFGTLNAVDVQAAKLLGELHDKMEDAFYRDHPLQVWMVRLLFCLFADSTGIFAMGLFREYLDRRTAEDGSDLGPRLTRLYEVLNTPLANRSSALDEQLAELPYVNGRLFAELLPIPDFNAEMRTLLLAATRLDWAAISPAIFGSLFQSIKDKEARRHLGEFYTTEANILKALQPLFLDPLRKEFARIKGNARQLQEFHLKLRRIQVLDPACGCGNFLVVAYRELRLLELEVLHARYTDAASFLRGMVKSIVDVDHFHGIELEEWPAQIAQVAMWLTDHQMNVRVSDEFGAAMVRLPLTASANILQGNALDMDWASVVEPAALSYIVGNPPFVGHQYRNVSQVADMERIWGKGGRLRRLDYVTCWYRKAVDLMQQVPHVHTAFVSTNSICQGEQVGTLWGDLLARGVRIAFAHRTFQWSSEVPGTAAVHCVIVGFQTTEPAKRILFDYSHQKSEPQDRVVQNINPYLVDGPDVLLPSRTEAPPGLPQLKQGSKPADGGHLLLTVAERMALLAAAPQAEKWLRPYVGGDELINGRQRWCLWLKTANPAEIRRVAPVMTRLNAVRAARGKSPTLSVREFAERPGAFTQDRQPDARYLAVPEVSSETRRFIPIAFLEADVIASNKLLTAIGATLFHFGILTSSMHMAWVRAVAGRWKSDYSYAPAVYNNFPWPTPTQARRAAIEARAQDVLDVRAGYPDATLADLYDRTTMPPDLVRAHTALDRAVDAAYGPPKGGWAREADRVAFLFRLYRTRNAPMDVPDHPKRRQPRRNRTLGPKPEA